MRLLTENDPKMTKNYLYCTPPATGEGAVIFPCFWFSTVFAWPPRDHLIKPWLCGLYKPGIHKHTNLHHPFTLTTGLFYGWLTDTDPPSYFPQVLTLSLTTMIGKWEGGQRKTLWGALTCIFMFKKGTKHFKRIIWADIYRLAGRFSGCRLSFLQNYLLLGCQAI